MIVDVATRLDCPADKAWEAVQTTALFLHVIWPLAAVTPVTGNTFPDRWRAGGTIHCQVALFRVIPIGIRTLSHESIDPVAREIVSHEHDPLVRQWNHRISIEPQGENACIYRDTIDIDAGRLTPIVCAWTRLFYRYRQWRWRNLVKRYPQYHLAEVMTKTERVRLSIWATIRHDAGSV